MFKPGLILLVLISLTTIFLTLQVPGKQRTAALFRSSYVRNEYIGEFTKIEFENILSPYDEAGDTVLFLSSIGTGDSYGKDRTFKDLFDTIKSFKYKPNQISLGILIEEEKEFHNVVEYFDTYFRELNYDNKLEYIHKFTILNAPFIAKSNGFNRIDRHKDEFQRKRRRKIALSRNFLLNSALTTEKYTLFIDADIYKLDHPDMLRRFINSDYDIVVPRVERGSNNDYDKNSWKGHRTKPTEEQLKKMDEGKYDEAKYTPFDVKPEMTHLAAYLNKPKEDKTRQLEFAFELDAVGGAILFAKSIVYLQGIQFPPNYIIGTTWDREEGYDGIETEGLCYTAKTSGYKCWGFPNLVAQHIVD